ncbi:hypothetical protein FA809_23055 [Salmonella enterica]|nr:hypothetical protein [Salmonella enterica]
MEYLTATKGQMWAEINRLKSILGENDVDLIEENKRLRTIIEENNLDNSNIGLDKENKRLQNLILDAHKPFYELDAEKRKEIDAIFDLHFKKENPHSIYYVIGQAAAYILRGQLTA